VKTADLTPGQTYAVTERLSSTPSVGLVLETALWREKDEWANWDGAESRSVARIWRKAPKGARVEGRQGWGRDYQKTGLPVLVLKSVGAYDFSERAGDNQIAETAQDILERARDNMNVMGLVAENHDGRRTDTTRRQIVIRVQTVKGTARKVTAELELMRPQQIASLWAPFVKREAEQAATKAAMAKSFAEASAQSVAQGQEFTARLSALLGDEKGPRNASDERYDFHRKWTSTNISSTYEVSADVIARLLDLAEKGASA
jgi:hypothetical protein